MLNAYPLVLSGGLSERQVSVKGALPLLLAGVPALLLLALGIWVALVWNKLVRQHNQVRASWAQVEVQLQRRHDLVPNLVGVVQGYAAHEHAALAEVAEARAGALGATRVAQRATAEQQLTGALDRLIAVAEAYPDLKADRQFAATHAELTATENQLSYARQFYNLAVRALTNTIQSVPTNLVAALFGFRPPEYFQAAEHVRGPVQARP